LDTDCSILLKFVMWVCDQSAEIVQGFKSSYHKIQGGGLCPNSKSLDDYNSASHGLFNFARTWYGLWSCDTQCTTNVQGQPPEVKVTAKYNVSAVKTGCPCDSAYCSRSLSSSFNV